MPRSVEKYQSEIPGLGDRRAWRHYGNGYAGIIGTSRVQGYSSDVLDYVDIAVDSSGNLLATLQADAGINIGKVDQGTGGTSAWKVDGTGGTFPVTAATLPLPTGAAKDSTLTDGSQRVGGTVAVSAIALPLPTGAATDSSITNGNLRGTINVASGQTVGLAAGTQAIGHVIVDTAPTTAVTGPLTDTQLRASAVPVSLATNSPDVTDRSGRLLGHVTVDSAPTTAVTGPVTDTQLRASAVPVSLATAPSTPVTNAGTFAVQSAATLAAETTKVIGTVNVAASQTIAATQATAANLNATVVQGTAAAASGAWMSKLTDGTNVCAVKAASTVVAATDPSQVVAQSPMRADAANLCVTNTAATGVACTLTIPAAGAGLFHYISLIEIQLYATTARTGGATPVLVTTTNLPGSPVWDFDTAQALGATIRQSTQPATPIKSSVANTATTVVAPIATTGIWRISVYYYAAP